MLAYNEFTKRNVGYVPEDLQQKIRHTRILVAGCGIGSFFAEAAVRLGFENLILVDGDTIDFPNLNRQNYTFEDIGQTKVKALGKRLRSINPNAAITEICAYLNKENTRQIVAQADLIFDTADFLDLAGVVGLHDECELQKKPAITALSVGWGAGCMYFPVDGQWSFRDVFRVDKDIPLEEQSYVKVYAPLIERLKGQLDDEVFAVVSKALTFMQDGTPCPASQVSPGTFSVGAMGATLAVRILSGSAIVPAPELLLLDTLGSLTSQGINLSK